MRIKLIHINVNRLYDIAWMLLLMYKYFGFINLFNFVSSKNTFLQTFRIVVVVSDYCQNEKSTPGRLPIKTLLFSKNTNLTHFYTLTRLYRISLARRVQGQVIRGDFFYIENSLDWMRHPVTKFHPTKQTLHDWVRVYRHILSQKGLYYQTKGSC